MDTVIIICNEAVVVSVKEGLQPLLLAKVTIVPDFDTGLKVVFERRPPVVFIQHEIAGVKGETVTRHIKSLLQGNSPRFVHLARTGTDIAGRDFDDSINLNLPPEELVESFHRCLEKVVAIRWKESGSDAGDPDWANETGEETPYLGEKEEFAGFDFPPASSSPVVLERGNGADAWPELDLFLPQDLPVSSSPPPGLESTGISLAVPASESPELPKGDTVGELAHPVPEETAPSRPTSLPPELLKAAIRPPPPPPEEPPAPAPSPPLSPPSSPPGGAAPIDLSGDWLNEPLNDEPPFPVETVDVAARRSSMMRLLLTGVIIVVLGGAASYVLLRPSTPMPAAPHAEPPRTPVAAPVASSVPPPVVAATMPTRDPLPSFVPADGTDPSYAAAHPGWERYVSSQREFLVYRENGAVRAVQIIALHKGGLEEVYLAQVLREMCGSESCTVTSRTKRGGYRIEQGNAGTTHDIVIYRKQGSGEIRGIVISPH